MPSSGSFYTYNSNALGGGAGFFTGWLFFIGYAVLAPGLFTALGTFGVGVPWWIFSLFAMAAVLGLSIRSIQASARVDTTLLVVEVMVFLILVLVANLRTGCLWGSRLRPDVLLDYLLGRAVAGPGPDWDVGHFLQVPACVRGPGGVLVILRDTYPQLGWDGHHLQPAAVVAAHVHPDVPWGAVGVAEGPVNASSSSDGVGGPRRVPASLAGPDPGTLPRDRGAPVARQRADGPDAPGGL